MPDELRELVAKSLLGKRLGTWGDHLRAADGVLADLRLEQVGVIAANQHAPTAWPHREGTGCGRVPHVPVYRLADPSGTQQIEAGCVLDHLFDMGWQLTPVAQTRPVQDPLPLASTSVLPKVAS